MHEVFLPCESLEAVFDLQGLEFALGLVDGLLIGVALRFELADLLCFAPPDADTLVADEEHDESEDDEREHVLIKHVAS